MAAEVAGFDIREPGGQPGRASPPGSQGAA